MNIRGLQEEMLSMSRTLRPFNILEIVSFLFSCLQETNFLKIITKNLMLHLKLVIS